MLAAQADKKIKKNHQRIISLSCAALTGDHGAQRNAGRVGICSAG